MISLLCCCQLLFVDASPHVLMEKMKVRDVFRKLHPPPPEQQHELIFAVSQRNLDLVESQLLERSSPGSPLYQNWLSFDEVGELTRNDASSNAVLAWLASNGATVKESTPYNHYIRATAPIKVWERLLYATFYVWSDENIREGSSVESSTFVRSERCSLPYDIAPHVTGVFNACQAPSHISHHAKRPSSVTSPSSSFFVPPTSSLAQQLLRGSPWKGGVQSDGPGTRARVQNSYVDPEYLSQYYHIPSGLGRAAFNLSQVSE
jgi:subtilase family serine protease